jgi:hypothetical protein
MGLLAQEASIQPAVYPYFSNKEVFLPSPFPLKSVFTCIFAIMIHGDEINSNSNELQCHSALNWIGPLIKIWVCK